MDSSREVVQHRPLFTTAQLARVKRRWTYVVSQLIPASEIEGFTLISDERLEALDVRLGAGTLGDTSALETLNARYVTWTQDGLVRRFSEGQEVFAELQEQVHHLAATAKTAREQMQNLLTTHQFVEDEVAIIAKAQGTDR